VADDADEADALRRFAATGRKLLSGDDAVSTHTDFEVWDETVGSWIDKAAPGSGLSAEWSSISSSSLVVAGGYYNDPRIWAGFKEGVQQRLRWLSTLPGRLDEERRRRQTATAARPPLAVPWSVLRSVLSEHFAFSDIKVIVGLTGIDMTALHHLEQTTERSATNSQLLSAIDRLFGELDAAEQERFVRVTAEEVLRRRSGLAARLGEYLSRLGWAIHQGSIVPVDLLDVSELPELPAAAREDLVKGAIRLRDGDLGGALTAACGAVDAATAEVYQQAGLGSPGSASFQERVTRSLKALDVVKRQETALASLGWKANELKMLSQNLAGALNQAAFVMQSLRSNMADVHGTRPVLRPLVFDSLKWAALIVRLLGTT